MIFLENVVKYTIEYNPSSKTWCLYRYNLNNNQRVLKPVYQSINKKEVEDYYDKLQEKRKKIYERTKLK